MGMVWLAQDEHLQELVALKFLPPQIRFDPAAVSMLRKETSRSRKLSHPNIVRIHDFHQHEDEPPFIAMEFVEGQTLHSLRFQQPNELFAWEKLAPWLRQLCDALDYAHSEKIIHRDLKPSNLMLDSGGRLKLADFGIAATVSDSVTRLTGTSGGTPAYMSPQQVDGKAPQPADDIYSLGATLYELLTGMPPFYTGQIVHQVLHNPPTTLRERLTETGAHNEIPPDVEAMIMACLAKEREQRPQSARAIADWIGLQPTPHPRSLEATVTPVEESLVEESAPAEPATGVSRNAIGIIAVFVLLGMLGAGVWFLKMRASKSTDPAKNGVVVENRGSAETALLKPIADGPYELINMDGQLPLEPDSSSEKPGAAIQHGLFAGTLEQQWVFTYAGNGFYTIRNAANGLYVTDPDGATTNGVELQQQPEESGAASDQQLWLAQPGQGGFAFFNKAASLAMNCPGMGDAFRKKIILYGRRDDPVNPNSVWFLRATPAAVVGTRPAPSEPGTFVMEDFENFPVGKTFNENWREGTVLSENGNHYLRIESHDLKHHGFISFFWLPEKWQQLTVSARVRTHGVKANGDPSGGARVNFDFYDRPDHCCYWGLAGESMKQDSDWVVESGSIERNELPAVASQLVHLDLDLNFASGIADFDDLKLTVVEQSHR